MPQEHVCLDVAPQEPRSEDVESAPSSAAGAAAL